MLGCLFPGKSIIECIKLEFFLSILTLIFITIFKLEATLRKCKATLMQICLQFYFLNEQLLNANLL